MSYFGIALQLCLSVCTYICKLLRYCVAAMVVCMYHYSLASNIGHSCGRWGVWITVLLDRIAQIIFPAFRERQLKEFCLLDQQPSNTKKELVTQKINQLHERREMKTICVFATHGAGGVGRSSLSEWISKLSKDIDLDRYIL